MAIEIRETIVTPAQDGDVVQLHISDAPPGDEFSAFDLHLTVKIPKFQAALLLHVQREAISIASDYLYGQAQEMAATIRQSGRDPRPVVKG